MSKLLKPIGTKANNDGVMLRGEAADYEAYAEWKDYVRTVRQLLSPRMEAVIREIRQGKKWAWAQHNNGAYLADYHQ